MGSESSLWKTLKKNMDPFWEAERVENNVSLGTPDVYYTLKETGTMGWIELKYLKKGPKLSETPVRVPHFTPSQRNFMKRHGSLGANIFMLIQIERTYLLLKWDIAIKIGGLTQFMLEDLSLGSWKNHIIYPTLNLLLK